MLALMKDCGLLADGQALKQIVIWESTMTSEYNFVRRWCLVVPCEGCDTFLPWNGDKVEWTRNV